MQARKNIELLLLAVLALALASAGCKQSKVSEQGSASPGAETTSAAQAGTQAPVEAPPTPPPVTLAEGTPIKVRLIPTLSTETHKTGETFEATLVEPLLAGDRTVAPKGATVIGTIVESDKGGRVEGVARIAVQLIRLRTDQGEIEISTNSIARQARTTRRADAGKVGIGAGVGAAIGAIAGGGKGAAIGAAAGGAGGTGVVLATRGKPAVLPSETVLTFKLKSPVQVTG